MICFDPKNELACLAFTKTVIIARLDNETPTPLGVQYEELFAGSRLVLADLEFHESFTSETGVHQERDYIILPDSSGEATFYPITDFRKSANAENSNPLELTLLVRPNNMKDYGDDPSLASLELVKDYVEITPDLLRFTLTQLMQNFAKYRGMGPRDLADFVKLRFNCDIKLTDAELVVDSNSAAIQEIRNFAERNLSKFVQLNINKPKLIKVNVVIENQPNLNQSLQKYLTDNLAKFEDAGRLKERVYQLVDMFYAVTFGLDANFAKSQNPCKIELNEAIEDEKSNTSENWATVTITSHKLTEEEEFWRTRL